MRRVDADLLRGVAIVCGVAAFVGLFVVLAVVIPDRKPLDVVLRSACAHHDGVKSVPDVDEDDIVLCRDGYVAHYDR